MKQFSITGGRKHPVICSKASHKRGFVSWFVFELTLLYNATFCPCPWNTSSSKLIKSLQPEEKTEKVCVCLCFVCVCIYIGMCVFVSCLTWKPCLPLHHVVSSLGGMSITDTMSPTCREVRLFLYLMPVEDINENWSHYKATLSLSIAIIRQGMFQAVWFVLIWCHKTYLISCRVCA